MYSAQIKETEEEVVRITNKLADLLEIYAECKTIAETLQNKDKTIDKNIKKEFQDCSPLIQEQSYKLFKYEI